MRLKHVAVPTALSGLPAGPLGRRHIAKGRWSLSGSGSRYRGRGTGGTVSTPDVASRLGCCRVVGDHFASSTSQAARNIRTLGIRGTHGCGPWRSGKVADRMVDDHRNCELPMSELFSPGRPAGSTRATPVSFWGEWPKCAPREWAG